MNTHAFQEAPLMSPGCIRPVSGWEGFLDDGQRYLKTARAAHIRQKSIFTPAILYNIIAMAIEKFVMAALMCHGTMPYNHAMVDLVAAMEENFGDAIGDIRDGLLGMDRYQEICDPDEFTISPPDIGDIPDMLQLAQRLQELVRHKLAVGEGVPGDAHRFPHDCARG